ncbi:MAG TPA: multiheme c-type cytochrome [Sandaracinaceae bacterium LLY-WYZ-13_1]|nr:multiheme c-type cytochrome [Sandaracinaceae bacterium LLY-WYZ-13_1]
MPGPSHRSLLAALLLGALSAGACDDPAGVAPPSIEAPVSDETASDDTATDDTATDETGSGGRGSDSRVAGATAYGAPGSDPHAPGAGVPRLPRGGPLYPETLVRLVEGDPRDAARLADVEVCGTCHEDVLTTWRSSAHARASFDNPWYRQAVESIRDERGPEASRFCAGCHDPVLLVDGAMASEIRPDDPRAHAGVTCLVCHGAREARPDGAGSYTLSTRAVPLPDPADREEVAAHVAAVTPDPLRTATLCGSCHRGFLGPDMGNPHHQGGIDDVTPWQRSGYAGSAATRVDEPVEPRTCQGCHMPEGPAPHGDMAADAAGHIRVHRVAGAHTALAAATGDAAQLRAAQANLRRAARIDVAAVRSADRDARWLPSDGAAIRPGESIELDVVVRNLGAGHRFPGGTLDAQDTWIEVEVHDARGALLASAGTAHAERTDPEAPDDPSTHRLQATLVDEEAEPDYRHRVHRFRAKVLDRTLGPRDAAVVRYALEVPEDAALPLSVRARLRHRRHNRQLHAAACASQSTPRGAAFRAASERLGRAPIDACAPQPITELADARVWIGEGADGRAAAGGATEATWRRLFDHGLALVSDVQEHLDDARPSLEAALAAAPSAHARAMVLGQRARLEGRQGRLDEALADARRAERLIGDHPALHRVRGDAYAQVWRWEDAARAYAAAAEDAPRDDSRWADLARAHGSAGDDEAALEAAVRGLLRQPRDESMLRSQYLALQRLERDGVDAAREAYLTHRVPDVLPQLRLACGRAHPWCANERLPVHTHPLVPAR